MGVDVEALVRSINETVRRRVIGRQCNMVTMERRLMSVSKTSANVS